MQCSIVAWSCSLQHQHQQQQHACIHHQMIHARICARVCDGPCMKSLLSILSKTKNQFAMHQCILYNIWCVRASVCVPTKMLQTLSVYQMHVHITNEKLENFNVNARTWTHEPTVRMEFIAFDFFESLAVAISFDTFISDLSSAIPWSDSIEPNMHALESGRNAIFYMRRWDMMCERFFCLAKSANVITI